MVKLDDLTLWGLGWSLSDLDENRQGFGLSLSGYCSLIPATQKYTGGAKFLAKYSIPSVSPHQILSHELCLPSTPVKRMGHSIWIVNIHTECPWTGGHAPALASRTPSPGWGIEPLCDQLTFIILNIEKYQHLSTDKIIFFCKKQKTCTISDAGDQGRGLQ